MRMNLRPYHVVTVGFLLSAACGAHEQGPTSSPSEDSTTGLATTSVDSLFANPRVCFDRSAPGDQFFREVLCSVGASDQAGELPSLVCIRTESLEPFQPNAKALATLTTSDEEAAKKLERIKQEMAELLDEHPASPAALEVRDVLNTIQQRTEQEAKEKRLLFYFGGVAFTR